MQERPGRLNPRRLARGWITSVIAMVIVCYGGPGAAGPVHLSQGARVGQGYAFVLDNRCFAFTAGHVLTLKDDAVVVVDSEGYRAQGRAVAIDTSLDLGLASIEGDARALRQLCGGSALRTDFRLNERIKVWRAGRHELWFDKITSAAGGLDRGTLGFGPPEGGPDASSSLLDVASSQRALHPQQGDSGAAVWVSERPGSTERGRYNSQGAATARVRGVLFGVLVSVDGDRPRVVHADRLHRFIFDTLAPMRWQDVRIGPVEPVGVEYRRGDLPTIRASAREAADVAEPLDFSTKELNQVSYELDLGDTDTTVTGATLAFAATRDARGKPITQRLRIASSQYRPGAQANWRNETCTSEQNRRQAKPNEVICHWKVDRIARGLRLEITGAPGALRRITLHATQQ